MVIDPHVRLNHLERDLETTKQKLESLQHQVLDVFDELLELRRELELLKQFNN